ncbi:MAG TPA: glycosyltransferase family 87 protein, partial [Herpetosiphonaceae bacterium]|nr:glycosyltransferase family 87 protein [Herpetosiphonaceae bacterium]
LRTNRDGLAGALVAMGTLFKIYPILLLAFFVVKRQWRAVAGFAAGMLVLNGVSVAAVGWQEHVTYYTQVLPRIGGTTGWVENQTVGGFLARFVAAPTSAAIVRHPLVTALLYGLGAGVMLAVSWYVGRPAERRSPAYAVQYGAIVLAMVWIVPAAWMHYETILLLVFAGLVRYYQDRPLPFRHALALATSFGLIAYGNQWSFYTGTVVSRATVAGISYKFYGMTLLAGCLFVLLRAQRPFGRIGPNWLRPRLRSPSREDYGATMAAPAMDSLSDGP